MSKRYTHYFDVRLANSFQSDIEDFDEAFDAWCNSFPDRPSLRKELLASDESTMSILKGVLHSDTCINQGSLAPAAAGDNS
jgi:hypothetical protein